MITIYEVPAGNPAIYRNPDVFQPKTEPGALEKPIHQDVRGVIQRLNKNNLPWLDEIGAKVDLPNLLHTKQGFMRSGDLHKNIQLDYILSGEVELWTFHNGQTTKKTLAPNTFLILNPHTPHLFNFLKDTVMMEWWDGPFEAWFYKPYRDIIDEQFKRMTQK